jgi:hypothetical protein
MTEEQVALYGGAPVALYGGALWLGPVVLAAHLLLVARQRADHPGREAPSGGAERQERRGTPTPVATSTGVGAARIGHPASAPQPDGGQPPERRISRHPGVELPRAVRRRGQGHSPAQLFGGCQSRQSVQKT